MGGTSGAAEEPPSSAIRWWSFWYTPCANAHSAAVMQRSSAAWASERAPICCASWMRATVLSCALLAAMSTSSLAACAADIPSSARAAGSLLASEATALPREREINQRPASGIPSRCIPLKNRVGGAHAQRLPLQTLAQVLTDHFCGIPARSRVSTLQLQAVDEPSQHYLLPAKRRAMQPTAEAPIAERRHAPVDLIRAKAAGYGEFKKNGASLPVPRGPFCKAKRGPFCKAKQGLRCE